MGIRFHCPNGHRLNVKSFLAGKRGYCPHCGVKLRIPLESEAQLPSNGKATSGGGQDLPSTFATPAPAASPAAAESWYVRPPSGGQFGPATAEVVNQWVAERRVPPNSLLWREGWADWRLASEVLGDGTLIAGADAFDDIAQLGLDVNGSTGLVVKGHAGSDVVGPGQVEIATPSNGPNVGKLRKRNKLRARAAVLLGLAALVLLAALLLITTSRS